MKAQVCQWGEQTSEVRLAGKARILERKNRTRFQVEKPFFKAFCSVRNALQAGGLRQATQCAALPVPALRRVPLPVSACYRLRLSQQ